MKPLAVVIVALATLILWPSLGLHSASVFAKTAKISATPPTVPPALTWVLAQTRKSAGSNSMETVSGLIEGWARQKNIVFERVHLVKEGPRWIASTRNTLGESRTFKLLVNENGATAPTGRGRPDNVLSGLTDQELLTGILPRLSPGIFSEVRDLPVDAVTGAPRRAYSLRLIGRADATYDFEILTAPY